MLKLTSTNGGLKILRVLLWSVPFVTMFSGPALSQTTVLSQVPNHMDNVRSDAQPFLPFVPSGDSVADNFILSSEKEINQIKIWGVYAYGNTAPAADNFTVIVHSDSVGLPGNVLSTQHNVPVTRQLTGGTSGVFTEYVYTLRLNPVMLGAGTYWVEIYNDTPGSPDDFYWEFGILDPLKGIAGAAEALTAPGSNWQVLYIDSDRRDLAIEITTAPFVAVPTMTEWGMIILAVLLGIGTVYYLRRRRLAM